MLKTKAGDTIGTGAAPAQVDAESVEETARASGLGRTIIYQAINPDPAKRGGLPFLRSMKVRKTRACITFGIDRRFACESTTVWAEYEDPFDSISEAYTTLFQPAQGTA